MRTLHASPPHDAAIPGPVLFPFTGAGVGGSHISAFNLARSLAEDCGIRTVVIAVAGSSVECEARAMDLEVFVVAGPAAVARSPTNDVRRLRERREVLKGFGANAILHCNDLWTLQAWGVAAKLLKLPVLYHHRAFQDMHIANRTLLRLADHVVCISDACRRNIGDLAGDRVANVFNPFPDAGLIDAEKGRAEFETLWPDADPLLLIGFAANFQARKRPEFFLEVCNVLAQTHPQARFVMFGRSRDSTLEQLGAHAGKLGVAGKLLLAGFRSPPERNLAPLDVLLAPALAEPFGRTLVEALLVGTPFVATDDAGHTEIVSRWGGGALVPAAATAEEFAAEVERVIAHPDQVRVPHERVRAIAEELSPRTHAHRVRDIYSCVVMRKRNRSRGRAGHPS